jgi:hypothetical protein
VEIDGVAIPFPDVTHGGSGGKDDLTVPSPNYSGAAATANFDVEIDGAVAGTTEDGISFEDDFSGGTLAQWTVDSGTWGVSSGQMYNGVDGAGGGGNIHIPSSQAIGTWEFKTSISGTSHDDYSLFHFMSASATFQTGAGYMVSVMKITSLSQLWYRLYRVSSGGAITQLSTTYAPTWDSAQHKIKITRESSGNTVVYVDGVVRISATDNTHTSSSYFGISSNPNPAGGFAGVNRYDDFVAWDGTEPTANRDTIKYNVNGGPYVSAQSLTSLRVGLVVGPARLMVDNTVAHNSSDVYDFKISTSGSPDKFQWRKNGGAWSAESNCLLYPYYTALDSGYSLTFDAITGNTPDDVYSFQVDGATTPDTYKWRKDAEAYTATVPVSSTATELKEGISVKFNYFTGHAVGGTADTWTFDVARDTVQYRDVLGAWTTGQVITGAYQTIVSGVQFKFSAINGHTLGDKWIIPIDVSVRFIKSFPYKNRLWAVGQDRLTAYFSELLQPTNFTGTGSGYIDFRYVIPEGDVLLDICSTLNYIVFFFRNHIVVYAGTDPTSGGDFTIYQNISGLGVIATDCVVPVGSDLMFLTPRGVKGLAQVINAGALNVNNVSSAIDADIISAIAANTSGVYASAHYQKYGLVLFLIGTTIFVYNYQQKAWSRIVIPSANDVSKVLSMFTAQDGSLYMGGYDYLFQFDPAVATLNFNGQAPAYRWTGPMWKTTTAESMFFSELLMRLASTAAVNLTVKVRAVGFDTGYEDQSAFNEQVIQIPAITTSDVVLNFARIPLFGAGRYVQIDITESPNYAANSDVEICSAEIHGELGIL